MSAKPMRLQLSRKKGFNLQVVSHAVNGLMAANVARPSRYGNKHRVGFDGDARECVRLYREDLKFAMAHPLGGILIKKQLHDLRGKNLACRCKPGAPCHADVLLEIANQ